jgi:uncharacterized protein (DUF1697 family)
MKKAPEEDSLIEYAAFLRGINVGGHTIIKMGELRKVFESLGFWNVKTVLASGNVLFEAPCENTAALSKQITGKLKDLLGREITVIVRSVEELRGLEASKPFKGIDLTTGARPIVTFVTDDLRDRAFSVPLPHEGFRILIISDGAICSVSYDQYGTGTAQSMSIIEKTFGHNVTTRTWDTIIRLLKASDTI